MGEPLSNKWGPLEALAGTWEGGDGLDVSYHNVEKEIGDTPYRERASFGPFASQIFDADTPGIHRPDFANYEYQKLRRPIYPLDGDVSYDAH